jgi:hypothetical protein
MKKLLLMLLFVSITVSLMAQNFTVSGRILDNTRKPLPGATAY